MIFNFDIYIWYMFYGLYCYGLCVMSCIKSVWKLAVYLTTNNQMNYCWFECLYVLEWHYSQAHVQNSEYFEIAILRLGDGCKQTLLTTTACNMNAWYECTIWSIKNALSRFNMKTYFLVQMSFSTVLPFYGNSRKNVPFQSLELTMFLRQHLCHPWLKLFGAKPLPGVFLLIFMETISDIWI